MGQGGWFARNCRIEKRVRLGTVLRLLRRRRAPVGQWLEVNQ